MAKKIAGTRKSAKKTPAKKAKAWNVWGIQLKDGTLAKVCTGSIGTCLYPTKQEAAAEVMEIGERVVKLRVEVIG